MRQRAVAAARGGQPLRLVPDHPRDLPRGPPRRLRPARPARHPGGHRAARDPRRQRRDAARLAVRARRCCSTTSPPTCTRATRRCSTGARRRWRSTATCCASCWAPRSCASCSMRDALGELELELQALTRERAAGSADEVHDLLRRLGDLTAEEVAARVRGADEDARRRAAGEWLEALARRPACGPRPHRGRGALDRGSRTPGATGTPWVSRLPAGVPDAFLVPPRGRAREACWPAGPGSHGPFLTDGPAARWGLPRGVVEAGLERLMASGRAAARRVPAGRRGARVVRPGGAAAAPAPLAGAPAPRDRAGGAAPPWRASCRPGRASAASVAGLDRLVGGHRPAGGAGAAGQRPGAGHPAGARPRLPAADARRAGRRRGGRLGRRRQPRAGRRTRRALSAGPAGAAAARRQRGMGRRP